jgi:hypothetical protein
MLNNLIEELRILAESILKEEQGSDLESKLNQARDLYEKLLILDHLEKETKEDNLPQEVEEEIEPEIELNIEIPEPVVEEVVKEEAQEELKPFIEEEQVPLSLNDLFVPTFDGIKEDMSQKAEFRDTISLDETENLFQTKKEEPRQLSLNDKLVGSSIQVGLNDRIAFVNKLFNFSQSDFNKALTRLNEFKSKDEALKYFQYQVKPNYNWKGKEELEDRLVNLIERKFI